MTLDLLLIQAIKELKIKIRVKIIKGRSRDISKGTTRTRICFTQQLVKQLLTMMIHINLA